MNAEQPGADDTFAEVLNGFTLGRRGKRKRAPAERPAPPPDDPGAPRPVWSEPRLSGVDSPAPGRLDLEALAADLGGPGEAAIVRPYSWTRGRTKSSVELRIEALVTTSERGDDLDAMTQIEHRSVARLCREPRSVAEVATLLEVPLGVAKVLVGDMADLGLVVVHKTATGGANKQHLLLMERVLSGLRRL
ncbi:MAG TPA: DUF742 domain-containing protein [Actinophytocola sp.]|uniref:DUF742 domain-containing protein n=1 Tax=Actinophytocola sp. TaxID=1872138 RepID=UPI002DDD2E75|nr:DUF742 domain-containing protein [Actinophytocola sp.]HEV2781012.1 DUF742 domain-containing protein [Actinophytocola sp.]